MKAIQIIIVTFFSLTLSVSVFGQKKLKSFSVSHKINAPIQQVWDVIANDFGNV